MRKFWVFFKANLQDSFAYKGDTVIWTLSSAAAPLVSLAVWYVVASSNPDFIFTKNELITYFLLVYFVQTLTNAWGAYFLTNEIRNGRYSIYLVKPFSPLMAYGANNTGEKMLKLLILVPSLILFSYLLLPDRVLDVEFNFLNISLFLISLFFAGSLYFIMDMMIGMLTFWVYNPEFIRNLNFLWFDVFSGLTIPIYVLPDFLKSLSIYLPYRYMISFPIEILMGKVVEGNILFGFTMQMLWLLVFYTLYKFLYKYSIKSHQGYGL